MLYLDNIKSGISCSAFRIDYTTGPDKKPAPRLSPLVRGSSILIHFGRFELKRSFNDRVVLDQPAKIYLTRPERLSFWLWVPTLNCAEEKVFKKNLKVFYDRANCLDQAYFPGMAFTGESTLTSSRIGYHKRRTGRTGTVYQKCGDNISSDAYRVVFPVEIIQQPRPNPDVSEQTPMQEQQSGELQSDPPKLELVAKEIRVKGDDSQSKQRHREMLKNEWMFVENYPHVSISLFFFPIFFARDSRAEMDILTWPLLTRLGFR